MTQNKTRPTDADVDAFLATVPDRRAAEARTLIAMMSDITGEAAVMWGPSIIGFGSYHYRYASGREGDAPVCAFSPRKAALTVYLPEGFGDHAELLAALGKHRTSVSCLYITRLSEVDADVLRELVTRSCATVRQV